MQELGKTNLTRPAPPRGAADLIEAPQGGEHRRPTFDSRRFCCSVRRRRKSFTEIRMGNRFSLGVHTAGSQWVLGGFRRIRWYSAGSWRLSAESRRVHRSFFSVFGRFSAYVQRALGDSHLGWYWTQFMEFWRPCGRQDDSRTGSPRGSQKR